MSESAKIGRPTALTDDVADTLVQMLRAGNYVGVAARAAGIHRSTLIDWMRRGKSDAPEDEPYRLLRERVEHARAEGEALNVARIAKAAQESWQAAAWLLERQYPQRWGKIAARRVDEPPPVPSVEDEPPAPDDPFAEVDDLAVKRLERAKTSAR